MFVTPLPSVAFASDVQPSNAHIPILVTLSGMEMPVSAEQPSKARSAISTVPAFTAQSPERLCAASNK